MLVAEVSFTEWTQDGNVRHPAFQGMREDKPQRRRCTRNSLTGNVSQTRCIAIQHESEESGSSSSCIGMRHHRFHHRRHHGTTSFRPPRRSLPLHPATHPPAARRYGRPPAPSTSRPPIRRSRPSRPTSSTSASPGKHRRRSPVRAAGLARACARPQVPRSACEAAPCHRKSTLNPPGRLLHTQARAVEMAILRSRSRLSRWPSPSSLRGYTGRISSGRRAS